MSTARREPGGDGERLRPPGGAAPSVGRLGLAARSLALEALRRAYPAGMLAGALGLLPLGGLFVVLRRWLRDEVELSDAGSVVEALGGVWCRGVRGDGADDLGPELARADAPRLFDELAELARRLGARPPRAVHLSYLPCCGVVAWGRRGGGPVLVVGLPLLDVLDRGELRAVLAHELAHLARGDAVRSLRAVRFVESLERGLRARPGRGPLRAAAAGAHALARRLLGPIARGQEERADRAAAAVAGGPAAASALVKIALVQPVFREVLDAYDPARPGVPNLYAFFRAFWSLLPTATREAMRHHVLADRAGPPDPAHPPLVDRVAVALQHGPRPRADAAEPAAHFLADVEACERLLHERLFAVDRPEPSVFHRAGR